MFKKIVRKKLPIGFGVVASISMLMADFNVSAQPNGPQNVTANNVTQVDFPVESHVESLAKTNSGEWLQYGDQGQVRFRFKETGRDQTSVYLLDVSRNFSIRVDLSDRTLSFQDQNGQKAVFGNITAMSAKPVIVQQQQPVRIIPQPLPTTQPTAVPQPAPFTPSPSAPPPSAPSPSTPPPTQNGGFNPFAVQTGQAAPEPAPAPMPAPASPRPSAPPWARPSTPAPTPSAPAQPVIPAVAEQSPFTGPWVERNKRHKRTGDGLTGPVLWDVPSVITITSSDPSVLTIRYDEEPVASTVLRKVNDNTYSGDGFTANFNQSGTSYFMSLRGPNVNRSYQMATTGNRLVLAKNRFDDAVLAGKDSRYGLFNGEGLTKDWNNNFFSYDAAEMDLFNAERGRRIQIFKQPGEFDHEKDDNMDQALPYGLSGYRIRSSDFSQTEAMITNEASFQKGMSYNFGGEAGIPGKGSAGVSYSREKTSGSRNSRGQTNAIGIARIEKFALIIDKPNMLLSDDFRSAVESLANGSMSASQFRQTYGTHYARAITYGGLGKAERSVSSQELSKFMSEKYSVSGSASFKGVGANGGFSQTESSSSGNTSLFTRESFQAIGGSGSATISGWNVSDADTVPVRYDLRPLSDLISPLFFPEEYGGAKMRAYNGARVNVLNEISRYMSSFPAPSNENFGPTVYQVEVKQLVCTHQGDESGPNVTIVGGIKALWHGDGGVQGIDLFNDPNGKNLHCQKNNSSGLNLGQKFTIVTSRNTPESRQSGFGSLTIFPAQLYEDDNSFTDLDDSIKELQGFGVQRPLNQIANGQTRFELFSGKDAPLLKVEYVVTELK